MITTLSKILPYISNCRLRINSIDYSSCSSFGIAELDCTAVDTEGEEMFSMVLPVPVHQVSAILSEVEKDNKVAPNSNSSPSAKKIRTNVGDRK
jgi:hypothetical protein